MLQCLLVIIHFLICFTQMDKRFIGLIWGIRIFRQKKCCISPGESIKVLRFNPFVAWEAYEDWERARNYQLLIGTRERRVPENECGIMRLYDVPNLMGDLIKKKEYKKLGKIVDIVYKERKKKTMNWHKKKYSNVSRLIIYEFANVRAV